MNNKVKLSLPKLFNVLPILPFCATSLISLFLFYCGLGYKENPVREILFIVGCILYASIAYIFYISTWIKEPTKRCMLIKLFVVGLIFVTFFYLRFLSLD